MGGGRKVRSKKQKAIAASEEEQASSFLVWIELPKNDFDLSDVARLKQILMDEAHDLSEELQVALLQKYLWVGSSGTVTEETAAGHAT